MPSATAMAGSGLCGSDRQRWLCSPIWFQRNPLPLDWQEQRRLIARFDT